MHVHSPIFSTNTLKKVPIALIVWVLGMVEENAQKRVKKNVKIFCFVLNKYQSKTNMFLHTFSRAFQKYILRSVALVTKIDGLF